jgi:hypothetical protein
MRRIDDLGWWDGFLTVLLLVVGLLCRPKDFFEQTDVSHDGYR